MRTASRTLDATLQKAMANGVSADAKLSANISIRPTSTILSHDVVHVQCHRLTYWRLRGMAMTAPPMFGLSHHLKVLYRIVQRIAIDVVNNLPAIQGAAKVLLHDDAVFKAKSTTNPNVTVTKGLVDVPAFVSRVLRSPFAQPRFGWILGSRHTHIVAPYNI